MSQQLDGLKEYEICAYKNCTNTRFTRDQTGKNCQLFRFPDPKKDPKRCEIWITNCSNEKCRKYTPHTIRRHGICADHFEFKDLKRCEIDGKLTLSKTAIPIHFHNFNKLRNSDAGLLTNEPPQKTNAHDSSKSQLLSTGSLNLPENSTLSANQSQSVSDEPLLKKRKVDYVEDSYSETLSTNSLETITKPLANKLFQSPLVSADITNCSTNVKSSASELPNTQNARKFVKYTTVIPMQQVEFLRKDLQRFKDENQTLKEEMKLLKQENEILKRKLNEKGQVKTYSRTKVSKKSYKESVEKVGKIVNEIQINQASKALITLQLHRQGMPYNDDEKAIAKQLYYQSPAALKSLQKVGCNFPSDTAIRNWLKDFEIRPGFCDKIFSKFGDRIMAVPAEQRICSVIFDETVIKSFEEYSKKYDLIEGLVDLGENKRTSTRAKSVFFFCVNSINAKNPWHQPIAYFLSENGLKAEEMKDLLLTLLGKLKDVGADVKYIVCDQGSTNRKAFEILGVTKDEPYFVHNGSKYFAAFDFPHLIKRLLSYLRGKDDLNTKPLYCRGKIIASHLDFKNTWEVDQCNESGSKLLSHISSIHLRPNSFQSMNVKRAFQVLSHTYAAAIETAGKSGKLPGNTWKETAKFTEDMNSAIDALNSYSLNMKVGGKLPLSQKNPKIIEIVEKLESSSAEWSTSPTKVSQKPFMKGMKQTTNAILQLYKSLVAKYPNFELATGLLNQDNVEHLFSKLRQRGGFNINPTARMIRIATGHIISNGSAYKSIGANVQSPEQITLINPSEDAGSTKVEEMNDETIRSAMRNIEINDGEDENMVEDAVEIERNLSSYINEKDSDESAQNKDSNPSRYENLDNYSQNAVLYFAGFIFRRLHEKYDCNDCLSMMAKVPLEPSTTDEEFIRNKDYGHDSDDEESPDVIHLSRPCDHYKKIFAIQLEHFEKIWKQYWHCPNLLKLLLSECTNATIQHDPKWFSHPKCRVHRIYALTYLLRVKIYAKTRENNKKFRESAKPIIDNKNQKVKKHSHQ